MRQFFDRIEAFIAWVAMVLLTVMVALIGSQVCARYILNQAFYWTDELGRHVMIWMVLLGAAVCLRRGHHLSINLLELRLSHRGRAVLRLLVDLILAGFFYLMISEGWTLAAKTMVQRSSALHYPMGLVYASLSVCGFIMFVFNIEQMARTVQSFKQRQKPAESSVTSPEGN